MITIKYYPPQIEGTIPAFYNKKILTVPFIMNRTVSWNEIDGFAIKIKNIQNNKLIANLTTLYEKTEDDDTKIYESNYNIDLCEAYFDTSAIEDFVVGNSYKIQMCYINAKKNENNEIISSIPTNYGYYSTVGIIKCTEEPDVSIKGLDKEKIQNDLYDYIGIYSQKDKDVTEKVYSYNFTVYDKNNEVYETSGELLHNHENNDSIYETTDCYTLKKTLQDNEIYKIVYTITTANGATKSSEHYRITKQDTVPSTLEAELVAEMNEENGYVFLSLKGEKNKDGSEKTGAGNFIICRASSEDDYASWTKLTTFSLFNESISQQSWKDFTIQHGYNYIYSIQQFNDKNQIYSTRMLSNEIEAKFEHSFLYDGERQLKIKFNPKIGNLKDTILEQKTNTLGGKYPYFFRNGNVKYKEFSISGLVSYLSDEEELFLTNKDLKLEDLSHLVRTNTLNPNVKSTDQEYFNSIPNALTAYILQEKYSRRENFNSQENQIARQKSRTTNLTDYNILAERIFKTKVLEFLNSEKPKLFRSPGEGNYIIRLMNSSLAPDDKLSRMIHTFSTTAVEIDDYNFENLNKYSLISFNNIDTKKYYKEEILPIYSDEWTAFGQNKNIVSLECVEMSFNDKIKIINFDKTEQLIYIGPSGQYKIDFEKPPIGLEYYSNQKKGKIIYTYYGTNNTSLFDNYKIINKIDVPYFQLLESSQGEDIKEYFKLEDFKNKIVKYHFLKFTKIKGDFIDADWESEKDFSKFKIGDQEEQELVGSEEIIFSESDIQNIPEIILGHGVCLEFSYSYREIEYDIEKTNNEIKRLKKEYEDAKKELQNEILSGKIETNQEYLEKIEELQDKYDNYIDLLEKEVNAL